MAIVKTGSEITNSRIGENSYFTGRFYINGSLKIDGKYEGQSLKAEQVYIGVTGKVKTNIQSSLVVIEGIVIGNILATNRVMLLPTARVLGDIKTSELIIQNGVILEGRCMINHDLKNSARHYIGNEYEQGSQSFEKLFTSRNNAKKKA